MNRREWIRKGALWTLGATVLTPELFERLTWTRRLFPGADFAPWPTFGRVMINGFGVNGKPISLSAPLTLDKFEHLVATVKTPAPMTIQGYMIVVDEQDTARDNDIRLGIGQVSARVDIGDSSFDMIAPIPGGAYSVNYGTGRTVRPK